MLHLEEQFAFLEIDMGFLQIAHALHIFVPKVGHNTIR